MSYFIAFGVNNDLGLVYKTNDPHFPRALGAGKGICLIDFSNEVGPALF